MSEFHTIFLERLSAHLSALKAAERILIDTTHPDWNEAFDSFRRMAHSLKGSGKRYGFYEIAEIAGFAEVVNREDIIKHLDLLIETLKKTIAQAEGEKAVILSIEDDPSVSKLIEAGLSSPNRKILVAETSINALRILSREKVSLILLDLNLPDVDGRNLLVILQEMPSAQQIPVIVLSGTKSIETKTECFALGAVAYFEKPFDMYLLTAAVASSLTLKAEFSSAEIRKLPDTSEENIKQTDQLRKELSIGVIELDHFKSIIESFGQTAAEEILHRFYRIMRATFRKTDHLDQQDDVRFVVSLANTNLGGAVRAIEKARHKIRTGNFRSPDGENLEITFSAGVAELMNDKTLNDTIDEANMYLQYVKTSGGNQIRAAKAFDESSPGKIIIAEDDELTASVIKHRLEQDKFEVLHFQDSASTLSAVSEVDVSLLILSTRMPVMDGFELLKKIRSNDKLSDVPIILLSSTQNEADIIRGFDLGADDYITKPFSPEEMKARIHRLLLRIK